MSSCAILVVNGFDRSGRWGDYPKQDARRYPWIELCLRQVMTHTSAGTYQVLVWDNANLPAQRRRLRDLPGVTVLPEGDQRVEHGHPASLDLLVRATPPDVEFVVTLDTDAFPVRDGWLDALTAPLAADAGVSGILRDELAPRIRPFIHPSCLCARREDLLSYGVSFLKGDGEDIGQTLSAVLSRGRGCAPLRRSNARNLHFIMGGLYGDTVYHHGAGSRRPTFWGHRHSESDELARRRLRGAAFSDLPRLLAVLRGETDDDLGLADRPPPPPRGWTRPSAAARVAPSATVPPLLRPGLDVATARAALKRDGIVEIPGFLSEHRAAVLRRFLARDMPADWWTLAIQAGDEPEYYRDVPGNSRWIADARARARARLREGRFSYMFRRTFDDHDAGCACPECGFRRELAGEQLAQFLAALGVDPGPPGDLFASRYSPGHFLSPHHDRGNGRVAFVLNLSRGWLPQWGGLLAFLHDDWRSVRRVVTPEYNMLCLFDLPAQQQIPHLVTEVVTGHRLAYSGWFQAG